MKVVIESNIGGGKSTIISQIQSDLRIPCFPEPLGDWSMLDDYYLDNERWGFTFNLEVLFSFEKWKFNRFDAIYERSPTSCRKVFVQMLIDNKKISEKEVKLFDKIHQIMAWKSDVVIYIRTDPKVCYDRMTKRGRECEAQVSLDYLKHAHEKHEIMAQAQDNCHVVDGNKPCQEVYQDVKNILRNINITNL